MEANLANGYKVKRHFTQRVKVPISKSYKAMATRDIQNANAGKFGGFVWQSKKPVFAWNEVTKKMEFTGKFEVVQGTYQRKLHGEIGRRER